MNRFIVLLLSFLLLPASPVFADFYRWVDREGREFFTNERNKIPMEYREGATVVRPEEDRVSVSDKAVVPEKAVAVSEHRDKYGRGEEYWHRKAENVRLKLRDLQNEYDHVLQQLDGHKAENNAGKKKKTISNLEKKRVKLERDISKTQRMLEVDLPEEARKADAYPGWLRE